jgi:hypothetical protein
MICKICNSKTEKKFSVKILHNYDAEYFQCAKCGFLFAADPYWLDEAYKSAINISDTGIMGRNLHFSKVVSVIIYFLFNKDGKFLDYAGGYGIFTRLMRDIGFDFYWHDPYCKNLLSRGFEYNASMKEEIKVITAFEVFEHLVNPINEIKKMLDISPNIFFSTELLSNPVPGPEEWWYFGFEHGQHVSFYSHKTLIFIAEKFGLYFYSYRDVHLFTKRNLSFSLFKILILLSKFGLFSYVKRNLKSKTWDDHLLFAKRE